MVMEKFIDHFMNLELPDGKSYRFVVCEVYILKGLQKIFLERSFRGQPLHIRIFENIIFSGSFYMKLITAHCLHLLKGINE